MNLTGINLAFAAYNCHDARFSFVPAFNVTIKQVFILTSNEIGNCTFEQIEWKGPENFEVKINGLKRESIGQKVDFEFHILWSDNNGKYYKQTLTHFRDIATLSNPIEINPESI